MEIANRCLPSGFTCVYTVVKRAGSRIWYQICVLLHTLKSMTYNCVVNIQSVGFSGSSLPPKLQHCIPNTHILCTALLLLWPVTESHFHQIPLVPAKKILHTRCKHSPQARDVQIEDGQAYRDTTEVCLLYVPAHDTPHQSIAIVEMFQRDQFA